MRHASRVRTPNPAPATPAAPSSSGTSSQALMRSSALMASGTLVSRILGLVRASLIVAAISTLASGDTFSVANTVPNALYILLAGGVLNAVLVPQITRAASHADGGEEYVQRLLTVAVVLLAVVTTAVTLAAPLFIRLYAADSWSDAQVSLAVAFAFWCLPQVFWYGIYTLLGQVLNARGSFGPYMWAPVVNNIVAITGLVAFMIVYGGGDRPVEEWSTGAVTLLAGTATLGVALQGLVLLIWTRKVGLRLRPRWGLRGFGLGTASRVAGWTFAAILISQLGYVIVSRVTTGALVTSAADTASATDAGKAVYDNSYLIFMLPHSLVTVSLVTALFTRLSVAAAADDLDEVRADLSLGLRLVGLATVVSTAAFIALGPDLTLSMFPGSPQSAAPIAAVATAMLIGLVPFSAQYLFQRVFYAFEDAKTPFLVQIPVILTWTVGNLLCANFLPGDLVVIGVGASMTLGNIVGAVLSAVILRRRLGGIDATRVVGTHARLLAAGTVAGVAAWLTSRAVHLVLGDSVLAAMSATVGGGIVLLAIYVAMLKVLRVDELAEVVGPLLRRVRPAASRAA